ncbi:hypothetical protein AOLI_G00142280 [Acnodon oligacanthus]
MAAETPFYLSLPRPTQRLQLYRTGFKAALTHHRPGRVRTLPASHQLSSSFPASSTPACETATCALYSLSFTLNGLAGVFPERAIEPGAELGEGEREVPMPRAMRPARHPQVFLAALL